MTWSSASKIRVFPGGQDMLRGWLIAVLLWGGGFYGALAATPACEAELPMQRLLACAVEQPPEGIGIGVTPGELRWLKFSLQAQAPMERWLGLGVPDTRHVELWMARPGQAPERLWLLGAEASFDARPVNTNRLSFPMQLAAGRTEVWLGYRLHANGKLTPHLASPEAARSLKARSDLLLGLIAGILSTLVLVVLAVRLVGKSNGYGAYAVLVILALLLLAQIEGYAFAWLWPESPQWNQLAPILMALAALAAHAGFALRFLQLRLRFARLWRWHLALLVALALATPLVVFIEVAEALVALLGFAYMPLAMLTALQAWRARMIGAPLYALGVLSVSLTALLLFGLGVLGWNPLPQVDFLAYPKFGLLAEAACFAAALVNRLRLQQQQVADERLHRLAEAEELLAAESERNAALALAEHHGLRLAGASHDISQPLASLRFAIEALRRQDASPTITQHLDRTLAYAQTLLNDLIQQTQGELPAPRQTVSLGPLMRQLATQHQAQASDKGLRLRVAPCSAEVHGSELILSRIINNLLSNALRYTQSGSVLLGVRRRPGALEIQVWDRGPGLLADQLDRLQKPFERGAGDQPGHGLGLFIVKNLCAQCGYPLTIRTRLGHGSSFSITVPTVSP